ncbi:hypothetical protein CI238_08979, partial [Colletotrichum incanum]
LLAMHFTVRRMVTWDPPLSSPRPSSCVRTQGRRGPHIAVFSASGPCFFPHAHRAGPEIPPPSQKLLLSNRPGRKHHHSSHFKSTNPFPPNTSTKWPSARRRSE